MKYFIDTEFIEGPQKERFPVSLFRKHTKPTIDLISIGIVAEDGREYYAVSKDFNLHEAWNRFDLKENQTSVFGPDHIKVNWIRENALKPIWRDLFFQADDCSGLSNKQTEAFYQGVVAGEYDQYFTFKSMKALIDKFGKTNWEISQEVKDFCNGYGDTFEPLAKNDKDIEFYAYYADYDWVVFCWLFGLMIDLPKGFPMYCKDLKQILDEKADKYLLHTVWENQRQVLDHFKKMPSFPINPNDHHALSDARWNKKLYEFLVTI